MVVAFFSHVSWRFFFFFWGWEGCVCVWGGGGNEAQQSIPCLHFFFSLFLEISLHAPVPLFRLGSVHSGSASWNNCGQVFPNELHVGSFPWLVVGSHSMPGQNSQPTFTSLGQGHAYLSVTCRQHFWQNGQGLLRVMTVTHEWNRHWIGSLQKVNSEEENYPIVLQVLNTQSFDYESGELPAKLSCHHLWRFNIKLTCCR